MSESPNDFRSTVEDAFAKPDSQSTFGGGGGSDVQAVLYLTVRYLLHVSPSIEPPAFSIYSSPYAMSKFNSQLGMTRVRLRRLCLYLTSCQATAGRGKSTASWCRP